MTLILLSNQGSDPTTLEMIKRIHTLQKRLLNKTEEVVQKELQIEEKERFYVELKQTLARKPGPEVAEQMFIYQSALKEKQAVLKVIMPSTFLCNKTIYPILSIPR